MRIDLGGKSFAGCAVLGRVRLHVGRGQRVVVLGPSGIGKLTLLRIIAGLDRDFDGSLGGNDRLAVVFQKTHPAAVAAGAGKRHPADRL